MQTARIRTTFLQATGQSLPTRTAKAALPFIFSAGLLFTGTAQAAPGGQHEARFPIDIAAVEAKAQERFARMDADQSGAVEMQEFEAAKPAHQRAGGKHHMRKGGHKQSGMQRGKQRRAGGAMGKPAREAVQNELFALLDADGDGNLNPQEFAQGDRETRALAMKRAVFKHLDANQDNALSQTEMPSPATRLRAADTDGDGQVSKDEMRVHRQSMRQAHRASNAG